MPPFADFEQSDAILGRAGERAANVAEQLGLEQVLGHGAAVDRHERPAGARRLVVNEARYPFLADAALAGEQHRRVDLRDAPRDVQHALHRRALEDQPRNVVVGAGPSS